jgi:hypothetical protein
MISVMRPRSLGVVVIAALGLALIASRQDRPRIEHAVADPSSMARSPIVTPDPDATDGEHESAKAGLAVMRDTANPAARSKKQTPPTPAADLTDPWTGEDLSAEVEAAVVARSLPIDRRDPWNPQTSYPSLPSRDIDLDPVDPWVHAGGPAPVRLAKKAEPKTLSQDDPWASL